MIREKGQALRVKLTTIFILFVFSLYPLPFTVTPTQAVDSTPSADIKAKLEELKKEIASKAAKLKAEVNRKLKDKAYTGKVKHKSQSAVTIASKNSPRIININQDTEFVSSIRGKKYSQNLIAEEDYIAALGDVDETGVLTAKKLLLLPTPDSQNKTYLWGQVISVSDKLITLKDKLGKNIALSLDNPSQVKVLDFVILTGILGKNEIFDVEFVYVIPQGASLKPARPAGGPKKTASPSAKLSSPSATPKSSVKPIFR